MKRSKKIINLARLLVVAFLFSIVDLSPMIAKATEEFKETIINDFTTGNGVNQFKFTGNWQTSTGMPNLFYNGDEHWTLISKGAENASSTYYTVKFEGEKIELYGDKSPVLGMYSVSIDGGEEIIVDAYNATKVNQQLLFESEILEKGVHTLLVKGTGLSSGTNADMQVDFVKVFSSPVRPTGIELSHKNLDLEIGSVQNLKASIIPNNAQVNELVWSSDNEEIATVENGLVTAVSTGVTNVTVTIKNTDISAKCEVTVMEGNGVKYFNTIINDFDIGSDINQFKYFGNWGTSTGLNGMHNGDEHWSSISVGNPNAANVYAEVLFEGNKIELYGTKDPNHGKYAVSVDGGEEVIVNAYNSTRINQQKLFESPTLAHGVHTLKVRATGESDGGQASIQVDFAKIQHEEIKATNIAINQKQISLEAGGSTTIDVEFTPINTSVKTLEFTSNNEDIATVDSNGKVTAIAVGEAVVTAKVPNTNLTASILIKVVEANEYVGGFVGTTERHYFQENYENYFGQVGSFESLSAWRNDIAVSKIVLYTKQNNVNNLNIKVNDLVNSNKDIIKGENVEFSFLKDVKANLGGVQPGEGYGQVVPNQPKQDVPEILYSSEAMDVEAGKLQQAWLEFKIPENAKPGIYTTTIEITADELKDPVIFDYEIEVLDLVQPTYEDSEFHLDLWQYPYSSARYYEVEPFSPEHLEILKPHMELYKKSGGKTITTTIVEDAWNHQTYDIYDSMIKWTKKLDGTFEFDYDHFDKWVQFNLDLGINKQISIFSIVPWENRVIYFDEATGEKVQVKASPGSEKWLELWNPAIDSLVKHLDEKGWFDMAYIAMDERPVYQMIPALDLLESKPNKEGNTLKVSGAMNYSTMDRDVLNRIDDISIHASHTNHYNDDVRELSRERRALGLNTTLYTCTGSYPSNFTRSEPSDNIWTIWYSAYHETDGYLRWAFDSWVEDPLVDSSHWYFEAGDTFLMYPGDKGSENIKARSSMRLEKMSEAIRDVEKINYIKKNAPELATEIDTFLRSIDRYGGYGNGYGMAEGNAATKDAVAKEAIRIKKEVNRISKKYLELKEPVEIVVGKIQDLKASSTYNQVNLSWEKPTQVAGLESYIIYKDGKIIDTIDANTTNYTINNLKNNTIYGFKVVTKYSNGEKSKPVSINIRTGIM